MNLKEEFLKELLWAYQDEEIELKAKEVALWGYSQGLKKAIEVAEGSRYIVPIAESTDRTRHWNDGCRWIANSLKSLLGGLE